MRTSPGCRAGPNVALRGTAQVRVPGRNREHVVEDQSRLKHHGAARRYHEPGAGRFSWSRSPPCAAPAVASRLPARTRHGAAGAGIGCSFEHLDHATQRVAGSGGGGAPVRAAPRTGERQRSAARCTRRAAAWDRRRPVSVVTSIAWRVGGYPIRGASSVRPTASAWDHPGGAASRTLAARARRWKYVPPGDPGSLLFLWPGRGGGFRISRANPFARAARWPGRRLSRRRIP
jgi:hypothetical protein